LLAALFLVAGIAKLVLPAEVLTADVAMPIAFLRFVAVCEVAGACGLILPAALRIRPVLTPLAAVGLAIVMAGATATVASGPTPSMTPFPLLSGLLAALVAYGRWKIRPVAPR
jgi:uncharacterized membrane protein YphA (DoxX/SURF4 family)